MNKENTILANEITLSNLTLKTIKQKGKKVKEVILKEVVFSYPESGKRERLFYSNIDDRRIIHRAGMKEDLLIVKVEVISRHGFKNKQL